MNSETFLNTLNQANHLRPLDTLEGFPVRPGFYQSNGATAIAGGVNFTVYSHGATSCELLLYHRLEEEPFAVLTFPENYKIGFTYSMIVFGLDIETFEYAYRLDGPYELSKGLLFDKHIPLLDPYARAVTGQSVWGSKPDSRLGYRARVVKNNFDWGNEPQPLIPMEDLIIYEMHVRGFTKHASSTVKNPGTFDGILEKIPYLKKLGVNAIELMPIFEFDEMSDLRMVDGKQMLNYWGYNTVSFFSPNTSYASVIEYNREGYELKKLIRTLHENNMEIILDVVFNHTAEGNEDGPSFSFKGFDNDIYYMLTPDGHYFNFSGCGNTLNCNHPVVQQMILECLRYWVVTYRVDGFRFDLASILGRNEDGSPMSQPPLLQALAFDPILGKVKLIAEAWDAGGLYQVGSFPSWKRWAEWNGKYRDDLRQFLKGDYWMAPAAAQRLIGSPDLYNPDARGHNASVNFLNCHDGFTLYDLYSYNAKHNEANGWDNTDGTNDNYSWNCGYEGYTDNWGVIQLRKNMILNAVTVLMCSRGTPMLLAGDEFCNTQFGNNNPYCQDNEISWLDWHGLKTFPDVFEFFCYMTHFRMEHDVLRSRLAPSKTGFPDVSLHTETAWNQNISSDSKVLCVLFSGYDPAKEREDIVYLATNVYWEDQVITLPQLPEGMKWGLMVDTSVGGRTFSLEYCVVVDGSYDMKARSVCVFVVVT